MAMTAEFTPDPAQPGYLYQKFADYLATLITAGTLSPGARLPGERDLAMEHGVSVGTVRRATTVLRDRGMVVTLPAKGTYVTPRASRPADLGSNEEPVGQILAAAQPGPDGDEMIIEDLTDEEERAFHHDLEVK